MEAFPASVGDTLYSGASGSETVSDSRIAHGGIEKSPPFIARAILIDVARYKGAGRLEPACAITPEDLEGALQAQGSDHGDEGLTFDLIDFMDRVNVGVIECGGGFRPSNETCPAFLVFYQVGAEKL